MKTLLIGSEGSMGKRYQAILKHLGKEFYAFDRDDSLFDILKSAESSLNAIIATPTSTHIDYLLLLEKFNIPVLCEKPLAMNRDDLTEIKHLVQRGMNLTMMMQYQMLDNKDSNGLTYYNYFRHGSDSLSWDCIQLIGLARGEIEIKDTSPVWQCILNGTELSLGDMDRAYVDYLESWYKNPGQDIHSLLTIHEKVQKYEEENAISNP